MQLWAQPLTVGPARVCWAEAALRLQHRQNPGVVTVAIVNVPLRGTQVRRAGLSAKPWKLEPRAVLALCANPMLFSPGLNHAIQQSSPALAGASRTRC